MPVEPVGSQIGTPASADRYLLPASWKHLTDCGHTARGKCSPFCTAGMCPSDLPLSSYGQWNVADVFDAWLGFVLATARYAVAGDNDLVG